MTLPARRKLKPEWTPLQAQPPRAYIDVAKRIMEAAGRDGLTAGDRLPSELDLARRLDVGRALIREAVVALQTSGYLASRPGSGIYLVRLGGGLEEIADLGPSLLEQFDARRLIEVHLAGHAARLATTAEIDRLEALVEEMERSLPDDRPELGAQFHIGLARAARRPILADAVEALMEMRGGPMWTTLRERRLRAAGHVETVRQRRTIVAALRAGDPVAASAALAELFAAGRAIYFDATPDPEAGTPSERAD